MRILKSLDEAEAVTAVKLCDKRQVARVGDLFRFSPYPEIFVWGRFIKRDKFFASFDANLVYIYDAMSPERPEKNLLTPSNLLIGPTVVNNLGWSRGYWQIMAREPLGPGDVLKQHLFIRFSGTGSKNDFTLVDDQGARVKRSPDSIDVSKLSQSGLSNFNHVDWIVRGILEDRGLIPSPLTS
jgi:hypothetical protein